MMPTIGLNDIARLDLSLAVAFLAIFQEGSVSRAAQRLSLSQSALSGSLARLRAITQDPLFIRRNGGMEPTPRAIAMAGDLEGVGLIAQALRPQPAFDPATSSARFAIGMSDDFELAMGPAIMRRVMAQAPGVTIAFRQTNRHLVEQAFTAGEIDLAVVADPPARSWLAAQELGRSAYACLYDPQVIEGPLTLEMFLALPHVLVAFSAHQGAVDQALRRIGHQRRAVTALTHFSALPGFLRGTRAISTIPTHAARALARDHGLVCNPVPVEMGDYGVSLLWKREAGHEWIRGVVEDAFKG
ncbi:LysR family transcriptional regulator [Novosphingobium sp.]|uniref:LysR family transcriptional regulator n=1 Tax=Novosphingobium sp. TaxID=1874826 RepID=UPI0031DE5BCF